MTDKSLRILTAAAMMVMATALAAPAKADTAMQMLAACHYTPPPSLSSFLIPKQLIRSIDDVACTSLLSGEVEGVTTGEALAHGHLICLPQGVSMDQALLVIRRYMAVHPERLNEQLGVMVAQALQEAFPCRY